MRSRPKVSWVMQARAAIVAVGAAGLVACDPGTDGGPAGEVRDGATALAPASASAGDSWAEALVSRWIDALGGMQAFYDFRTARFTLTTELYDVETGRLQRTRPRYVALAKTEDEELSRIERWIWDGRRPNHGEVRNGNVVPTRGRNNQNGSDLGCGLVRRGNDHPSGRAPPHR